MWYRKALIFVGCIFHEFHELDFIHEINFQRKLIRRYVICVLIIMYFVRPVHKMTLYKYFKNAPSVRFSLGLYGVGSHFFS